MAIQPRNWGERRRGEIRRFFGARQAIEHKKKKAPRTIPRATHRQEKRKRKKKINKKKRNRREIQARSDPILT
jgi:hypothetical protein